MFLKERSVKVPFVCLNVTGNYGFELSFSLNSAPSLNQSFHVHDYAVTAGLENASAIPRVDAFLYSLYSRSLYTFDPDVEKLYW